MSIQELQEALPKWVRLERRQGDPELKVRKAGDVGVIELNTFPEEPPNAVRADVHFVMVAPNEGFPDKDELIRVVVGAIGKGEFSEITAEDLAGGPSFITLGGWLGSQDLALMLIGAVELARIAKAITPKALGMSDRTAEAMAGAGLVMLGPYPWLDPARTSQDQSSGPSGGRG